MQLKDEEIKPVEIGTKEAREEVLQITESYPTKITLKLNIEKNLCFTTDKELFVIILKNLLDNCYQFFDEEKEENCINIEIREVKDEWIKLVIQDNGVGIDEEIRGKVYDLFFRGNRKSKGSGLGLFIVKKAVEKLEGNINLASIPHKGTTFSITLKKNLKG